MDIVLIVAIVGFAVLCGAVSMKIAAGKGRNPIVWGAVGLVVNLPGLLIVVVVPRHDQRRAVVQDRRPAGSSADSRGAKAAMA